MAKSERGAAGFAAKQLAEGMRVLVVQQQDVSLMESLVVLSKSLARSTSAWWMCCCVLRPVSARSKSLRYVGDTWSTLYFDVPALRLATF